MTTKLIDFEQGNPEHLRAMYAVRTHPEVAKHLRNPPPDYFSSHIQYLDQAIKSGTKKFFVICHAGTLCGYCHVTFREESLELGWAIHPEWWNKGIGKCSIALLIRYLRESGLSERKLLTLTVKKDNLRALSLYKKSGFIIVSEIEGQEYSMQYQNSPEVSVIMSTYRRNYGDETCANFLKRALQSILSQTFSDFELILIDDGSTDGTAEICKRAAEDDARIRYIRFDDNSGLPAKRYNQGISFSRGKWIAFMFDDDEWLPNALEDLYQAITSLPPIYGMVNGTAHFAFINGSIIHKDLGGESTSFRKMFLANRICNNTVLIRREVFDHVGGYDEAVCMRRICDWDLWIRIGMRYKIHAIPKRISRVYVGLLDSLAQNVILNYHSVYARQLLFLRKQPLRKHCFRMSIEQWKHFLRLLIRMPYYIYLRYKEIM